MLESLLIYSTDSKSGVNSVILIDILILRLFLVSQLHSIFPKGIVRTCILTTTEVELLLHNASNFDTDSSHTSSTCTTESEFLGETYRGLFLELNPSIEQLSRIPHQKKIRATINMNYFRFVASCYQSVIHGNGIPPALGVLDMPDDSAINFKSIYSGFRGPYTSPVWPSSIAILKEVLTVYPISGSDTSESSVTIDLDKIPFKTSMKKISRHDRIKRCIAEQVLQMKEIVGNELQVADKFAESLLKALSLTEDDGKWHLRQIDFETGKVTSFRMIALPQIGISPDFLIHESGSKKDIQNCVDQGVSLNRPLLHCWWQSFPYHVANSAAHKNSVSKILGYIAGRKTESGTAWIRRSWMLDFTTSVPRP